MAAGVFNNAKGAFAYYIANPGAGRIRALMLKTVEAEATLLDRTNLLTSGTGLLQGSNVECNFTNYARLTVTALSAVPDNTNDWKDITGTFGTITNAGGAVNNTIAKVITYYDPASNDNATNAILLTYHDLINPVTNAVAVTDGTSLTIGVPSPGFARAA